MRRERDEEWSRRRRERKEEMVGIFFTHKLRRCGRRLMPAADTPPKVVPLVEEEEPSCCAEQLTAHNPRLGRFCSLTKDSLRSLSQDLLVPPLVLGGQRRHHPSDCRGFDPPMNRSSSSAITPGTQPGDQPKLPLPLRVWRGFRYYQVNIVFISLATGLIYADWSHTQKWKAEKGLERKERKE